MARGTVQIDSQRCKGCGLCIAACPQHVLVFSPDLNAQGYHPVMVVEATELTDESAVRELHACTGCALCALVCPDTVFHVYREIVRRSARSARPAPDARADGFARMPAAAGQENLHERALERE